MKKLLKVNEIKSVGTKYLSAVINIQEVLEHETSLIISNCGSGKTQMVFKKLIPNFDKSKVLYLCDTSNLVNAITTSNEKYNCTIDSENIMTYAKASYIAQGDNENVWLSKYDLIVCDEVHSLVNYDNKYINRLQKILEYVTMKHENTKIVMLTATPFYFDVYCNKYNYFYISSITYSPIYDVYLSAKLITRSQYLSSSIILASPWAAPPTTNLSFSHLAASNSRPCISYGTNRSSLP